MFRLQKDSSSDNFKQIKPSRVNATNNYKKKGAFESNDSQNEEQTVSQSTQARATRFTKSSANLQFSFQYAESK